MGITISTLDYQEEIKRKLSGLIFDEHESRDYTLFKIDFDQHKKYNAVEHLSSIIADIVIDNLEKKFINRFIRYKYQQFTNDEMDQIQKMAVDNLNISITPDKGLGKILRREEIVRQIMRYFNRNQDINVEGFVRFRLKDYIDDLKLAVERSVDDFIIEKEYNEFIELLRYFVDIQEPRISTANIIKKNDGSFQIYDKHGSVINNEYLEGYLAEMFEEDVEYEDLLVSALINVAPLNIVLHFDDLETEETVKKIFDKKVIVCEGCDYCNMSKSDDGE
ncbi:MAG: sporulation protein YtxC [Halanaerobiaceae bacterium]